MKHILAVCLVAVSVSGCEALRVVAPQTVAGFETGGVLGALDGASGAILARCKTLNGSLIRVAIDDIALETGSDPLVERVRVARAKACSLAGGVQVISNGLAE